MLVPAPRSVYPSWSEAVADVTDAQEQRRFGFMRPSPVGPRLLEVVDVPDREVVRCRHVADGEGVLRDARAPDRLARPVPRCRRRPRRAWRLVQDLVVELSAIGRPCRSDPFPSPSAEVDHQRRRRAALVLRQDAMKSMALCSQVLRHRRIVALPDLGSPDDRCRRGAPHARGHAPVAAVGAAGAGDRAQDVRAVPDSGR